MATQALNRKAQNHPLGPPRWTKGQKVWLDAKNLMLSYGTIKLAPRRHGPFEIEKVVSPVVYKLRLPPQWNIHPVFHASLLTPYAETKEHGENYTRPPPDMIEGEAEYEVEAVQAHRYRRRKLQYLIKWKGYPNSDNTWEPLDNICAPQLIKKYHATHPLEDKKTTVQARTISPISQSTRSFDVPLRNTHPHWPLTTDTSPTHQFLFGTSHLQHGTSTPTTQNLPRPRKRPNAIRQRKTNPRSSIDKPTQLSATTPSVYSTDKRCPMLRLPPNSSTSSIPSRFATPQ